MTHQQPGPTCSRRAALRHLGLAGLGATVVAVTGPALATAGDRTAHPMIGHWLAATPLGPAHVVFDARGGVLVTWPHSEDIEAGTFAYTTSAAGIWQPVSDRGIHFAAVQIESAVGGAVTGTTSLESIIVASADGGSFRSASASEPVTAWASVAMAHLVVRSDVAEPALSGIRMWPESPA